MFNDVSELGGVGGVGGGWWWVEWVVVGGDGCQGLIEFVNSTTCVSLRPPGGQAVKGENQGVMEDLEATSLILA